MPTPYGTGKETLLKAVGVKKSYTRGLHEVQALRGVDLDIYEGEYLCIMGPSGSGKSTFFNMIGGLDSPTGGRIFIKGVDMAQLNAEELAFLRCRRIGYIFQSYNLSPVMTALDNIMLPMIFAGIPGDEARRRGMEILRKVGLSDRWHHRPKELSGGQQQRVAIGRALANRPSILLCDEPTANLDFKTGREIHQVLMDLNKNDGVTVICATHDWDMLAVSDRMVWVADGRIEKIQLTAEMKIEKASFGEDAHGH